MLVCFWEGWVVALSKMVFGWLICDTTSVVVGKTHFTRHKEGQMKKDKVGWFPQPKREHKRDMQAYECRTIRFPTVSEIKGGTQTTHDMREQEFSLLL